MKSIIFLVLAMLLAPIYSGLILKVKAFFGGRKGSPLLINYYTLSKLFKKGSVYSTSTTVIFKLGPLVSLCTATTVLMFLPIAGQAPLFSFNGDIILLLVPDGTGAVFTIAAAMDTASPFEGMGAAREAYFPIICEATLFMILVLFFILTGELRLAAYFSGGQTQGLWQTAGAPLLFVVIAIFIVLLTENSRVPVDDPATHLELTMIHEVMVLDHSGPDFAFIELGAFFKLFFYSSLVTRLICPLTLGNPVADGARFLCRHGRGLHGRGRYRIGHGPFSHGQGPPVRADVFCPGLFCNRHHLGVYEMIQSVDTILAVVLLSVLFSFGSSRLPALIKIIAFQGVVVSIVPFFLGHDLTPGGAVFTVVTLLIRGLVIPLCIYLAIKKVAIHREVEPIVSYHASLLAGLVLIVAATYVGSRLNVPQASGYALLLPTAITPSGRGNVPADGPAQCHRHGAGLHHDGKRHLPGGHQFFRSRPSHRGVRHPAGRSGRCDDHGHHSAEYQTGV